MLPPFPKGPSFEGTLVYCPRCYPTIGMHGDQRHRGDFMPDAPGGRYIRLYDMHGVEVHNVYRAVFPYDGPPVTESTLMENGRPVQCGTCGVEFLRHVQVHEGLTVEFLPGFPEDMKPYWLDSRYKADVDRIRNAARMVRGA